ncbi:hypothetical protein N474_21010 [Pseudoalteromonas luteoviolacea CPMOR-2]|nr:hypothetical protein N474_21010 [Pseudoalteromonas luteoviolacea CPMOR-2]
MEIISNFPVDINHLINSAIWLLLLFSVIASGKSPTVRWIASCILIARTLDVILYPWSLTTGSWFYIIISFQDLALLLAILFRFQITNNLSNRNIWIISRFSRKYARKFKLTSNEIMYILILSISILINIASLIERGIRKLTEYNPMFIYNAFEPTKWVLTLLSVMAICSLTIDALRGYYTDKRVEKVS